MSTRSRVAFQLHVRNALMLLQTKVLQCFKSLCNMLWFLYHSCRTLSSSFFCVLLLRVNSFWLQLSYFLTLSVLGYFALAITQPRTTTFHPKDFDLFFTSVSAVTLSSMATLEMEDFSNTQQMFLAILIVVGGQIFTSLLELQLKLFRFSRAEETNENRVDSFSTKSASSPDLEADMTKSLTNTASYIYDDIRYKSIKCLSIVVLTYFLAVQVSGFTLVSLYTWLNSSASEVLKRKGLNTLEFAYFTTVSSFTNCGFVPTNENMTVFKKNTGLLLILIPQILLGNTLYPVFLRLLIRVLKRVGNRVEFDYLLENRKELRYHHLLSGLHSYCLGVTAVAFVLIQLALFAGMEWNSDAAAGLTSSEKGVAILFQVVNSRHSGESVFDLSLLSRAILVLFVAMMYLPPYSHFLLAEEDGNVSGAEKKGRTKRKGCADFLLSPIPFLVVLIIFICITERDKMHKDPLNFNVFNIVFEVTSAYGNVGLSLGYSCKLKLERDGNCKDAWYGFVGRWSTNGKLILIIVMIFGRLRKFHEKCGRAWKLS